MQTLQTFISGMLAELAKWSPLEVAIVSVHMSLVLVLIGFSLAVLRMHRQLKNIAAPILTQTVHEAEERAELVLKDARQQAADLRLRAQKEADEITSERKKEGQAYRALVSKNIEELAAHEQQLLKEQVTTITQLVERIGADIAKKASSAELVVANESEEIKKLFADERSKLSAAFAAIESNAKKEYEALVAGMQKQMADEISKEIDQTRIAVGKYREEKLALVQKEIVGLVEDTVRLSLGKTLSLEEHKEVVLKALSDAKAQGIFKTS